MTEFNVGSIVRPLWDDTARGKVVEIKDGIRIVEWFQGDLDLLSRAWHVNNLKFVTPVEKNVNTIKCKPVPNTLEVQDGDWKYVVVNRHENKIVAAFVNEMDAEQYVQTYSGTYYIREVDEGK